MPIEQATARFLYWGLAERIRPNYSIAKKGYIFYYGIRKLNAFPVTIVSLASWITALGL